MTRHRWNHLIPGRLQRSERLAPIGSFLAMAFHFVERQVRGFYSAVGLFLSVGLVLACLAVWGFAGIAESMVEGGTRHFDEAILLWLNQHATERLDVVALEVTALGDAAVVIVLVLVASFLLWLTHHRHLAVTLWVATVGGVLINTVLKLAFNRPRPQVVEWRIDYAGLSSFPSGHAMIAAVVYVTLAYVITRLGPARAMRTVTLTVSALLIFLIGVSRLYLGVHYPSDVIAGYAVGFAWAAFASFAVEAIRRTRTRTGADAPSAQPPLPTPE